jgi:glycosyltransferase involved in cell wall biosynthesis
MRVLHVITGLDVGGAETQLVEIVKHTRHEPDVIGLYDFGRAGRELTSLGVRARSLELTRNYDVRILPRLVRLIRGGEYGVVHFHLYRAMIYGRPAAALANVPVSVGTEHSLGERELEGRKLNRGIRALYLAAERLSDMTIAVSEWVAGRLRDWGVPDHRITVIPNGIDTERFAYRPAARAAVREELAIPPDAIVVGSVGRLVPGKRRDLLIHAAAEIVREGGWLLIAGAGPQLASLEGLARALGIGERTLFLGARGDVPDLLSAMDVFASPAAEEVFGLAAVEALASGLPVVVSHNPALEGLAQPLVWWGGDEPETVESGLRAALAAAGRRRPAGAVQLRDFDVRTTAAAIDDLYDALIARSDR